MEVIMELMAVTTGTTLSGTATIIPGGCVDIMIFIVGIGGAITVTILI
ncbi:MAG: hypothetical protein V3R35_03085 [Woeseiaceae bacterium]